jgi:hypothetical protein
MTYSQTFLETESDILHVVAVHHRLDHDRIHRLGLPADCYFGRFFAGRRIMTAAPDDLDKARLDAAFEAYWEAEGGTYGGIEAAIAAYLAEPAHKVMTPDEYAAMPLQGWHMVCRDVDGFGGVGVRFLPQRT